MNKIYGICLMDCEVIGETREKLKIADIVKIVSENREEEKYSIKLRDENCGPVSLKFEKNIYLCDWKNICVVPNNLLPFLVDTDYFGRLDVLRFKKKILNLKVRSKGKLQVIYKNERYLIECLVKYIGQDSLGAGWFVYVELMDFDLHGDSRLYKLLLNQYQNERSTNWLTIKVELLFTEIQLFDSFNEREKFSPIYNNLSSLTTRCKQSPTGTVKSSNIQHYFGKDKTNIVHNINSNKIFNDAKRSPRSTSDILKHSDLYAGKDTTNIPFNINARRNENPELRSNYPYSEIEINEPNLKDLHVSMVNKYSENKPKM